MNALWTVRCITFVAGTMIGTSAFAQCIAPERHVVEAHRAITVNVDAVDATVGLPFRVSWRMPAAIRDPAAPAYLIVAVPDVVRFGNGSFFTLRPGARAPFGIDFGKNLTRAVVPLHSVFSETEGEIEIVPYRAIELQLTWALIYPGKCQDKIVAGPHTATARVKAGAVQLITQDEFSPVRPVSVRRAYSGRYEIRIHKDRFEVIEPRTGELILSEEGRNPSFSPTGRFLVSETLGEETIRLFDLDSSTEIYQGIGRAVAFTWEDSFAVVSDWGPGMIFIRTLQDVEAGKAEPEQTSAIGSDDNDDKLTLGTSLGGHRSTGSDGSFDGQRAFRLSLDLGTISYQERVAYGRNEEQYSELAVEVRDLATMKLYDTSLPVAQEEARKFVRKPRNRELEAWHSGDKISVIFRHSDTGLPLTIASRSIALPKRDDATVARRTGISKSRATYVDGKLVARAIGSTATRLDASIGIMPFEEVKAERTSKDKALARQIERELSRVYNPKVAKFGPVKTVGYESTPFPDPNRASDGSVPEEIDLSHPGYVVWRFTSGTTKFWLGQTVEAGRRMRAFNYSLLAATGNSPKLVDLIGNSNIDSLELGDFRLELEKAIREPATVTVISGRYVALVPKPAHGIVVFDLETWVPHCLIETPEDPNLARWITLANNGGEVLQFNVDGSFSLYSCQTGGLLLSGAYIDDEVVVIHPDGFFDGSDEAASFVRLKIEGIPGRHFLAQYAAKLKRPGLVADVLAGTDLRSPDLRSPPVLQSTLDSSSPSGKAVRFVAEGALPLLEARIYADGKLLRSIQLSDYRASFTLPLADLNGFRHVTAIALDTAGVASPSVLVRGVSNVVSKRGTLFALALGIDDYEDKGLPQLGYAASDAKRVLGTLGEVKGYTKVVRQNILAHQASVDSVRREVRKMVQTAGSNDTVVFFFAGHGLAGADGSLALALSKTNLGNLSNSALHWEFVAAELSGSTARVVVLLDTCHAGLSDRAHLATNDQAALKLITRSGASMIVLSASKGRQFSMESRGAGGGYFSSAFTRIVGKGRSTFDQNRNGVIEIGELYSGLKSEVSRATRGQQIPMLFRNELLGDFPLF